MATTNFAHDLEQLKALPNFITQHTFWRKYLIWSREEPGLGIEMNFPLGLSQLMLLLLPDLKLANRDVSTQDSPESTLKIFQLKRPAKNRPRNSFHPNRLEKWFLGDKFPEKGYRLEKNGSRQGLPITIKVKDSVLNFGGKVHLKSRNIFFLKLKEKMGGHFFPSSLFVNYDLAGRVSC